MQGVGDDALNASLMAHLENHGELKNCGEITSFSYGRRSARGVGELEKDADTREAVYQCTAL